MAHHALGHFDSFERALASGDEPVLTKASRWLEDLGQRALRHLPDDEVEADAWALRLCASAGYEGGALEFFDLARRVALDHRALGAVFGGEEDVAWLDAVVARLAGCGPTHPAIDARREAALRSVGRNEVTEHEPAPAGLTSTTMVCACAECAVRFAPLPRCPRCGTPAVYDLREPKARSELVRLLYRSGAPRDRSHALGGGAVVTASGGVMAALLALGSDLGNAIGGGLLALVAGVALYATVGGIAKLIIDDRKLDRVPYSIKRAARLHPIALRGGGEGERVEGIGVIRVLRSVTAPLSGRRCAAYRIVGEGPSGVIDDAEIGELEIVGTWGCARIDGAGLIGLAVDDTPERAPVGPELEAFLRARGVCPSDAEAYLAEALVLEGDRVSVRGAGEARLVTRGLRTEEKAWFLTWPELERASEGPT
jgi:hypothetical protein